MVISSELLQHDHAKEETGDPRRRALGRRVLVPRVDKAEDHRVILGFCHAQQRNERSVVASTT